MKSPVFLLLILWVTTTRVLSQSTIITPGTFGNNVQTSSTKGGIQFPVMPFDSIKAAPNPVVGTTIFDSDNRCLRVYDGSFWQRTSSNLPFGWGQGDYKLWQTGIVQNLPQFSSIQTNDLIADTLGHLYICGQASGNYNIGGNVYSFVPPDAGFVAKYTLQGTLVWLKIFSTNDGFSRPKRLSYDKSNNSIAVCGDFINTLTVAGVSVSTPSPLNFGAFVAKLDANGNVLWLRGENGPPPLGSNVSANDVTVGTGGDVFFVGSIRGTLDASPSGTVSSGDNSTTDILLYKYNNSGQRIWAKDLGNNAANEVGTALTFREDKLYLTGSYSSTTTLSSITLTSPAGSSPNAFLARTNTSNGDIEWAVAINGGGSDTGTDVVFNATGQLYVAGLASSNSNTPVTFNSSAGSSLSMSTVNNTPDVFIAQYSSSGIVARYTRLGGQAAEEGLPQLAADTQGNIFLAATPRTPAYIGGTNLEGYEGKQAVFSKFNSSLHLEWYFLVDGYSNDEARAIAVTPAGWVYATGLFADFSYFQNVSLNPNQGTLFLIRYRE